MDKFVSQFTAVTSAPNNAQFPFVLLGDTRNFRIALSDLLASETGISTGTDVPVAQTSLIHIRVDTGIRELWVKANSAWELWVKAE